MNIKQLSGRLILTLLVAVPTAHSEEKLSLQDQAIQIRKQIEAGPPQFSLIGKIERGSQTEFSVNSEDFVIDSETRISGNLKVGSSGTVRGERVGGRNYAKKITIDQGSVVQSNQSNEQERLAEAPILGDGPQALKLP